MAKALLNEYEAAVRVGMSPRLLRWLAKYAPKHDDPRTLVISKQEGDIVFFDEQELVSFNEWLKKPWPRKNGKRPYIPTGIREEIKIEANGECAICHSNRDSCEAAHLDPVAKSDNNHPENLLWLCSNHHTVYDKGLYGPKAQDADFVAGFKQTLHFHEKSQWRMQIEVRHKLFLVLEDCSRLEEQLKTATTEEHVKAVESIARKSLNQLPNLAPVSLADPSYKAYQAISLQLSELVGDSNGPKAVARQLGAAKSIRRQYVAALGYVPCPLCDARGVFDGSDCPVCHGDREIPESDAKTVDLTEYEHVPCPLCRGSGLHDGENCPECNGEKEVARWYANQVDIAQYDRITCQLCAGKRTFEGDDCPECNGQGTVPRWYADNMDLSKYVKVSCPLCKGKGLFEGEYCPECNGDKEVPSWHADHIDLSKYNKISCPLCKGKGIFDGEDCPVCDGERKVPSWFAESTDLSQYDEVECPACHGKGYVHEDECSFCEATKRVRRHHADNFDSFGF